MARRADLLDLLLLLAEFLALQLLEPTFLPVLVDLYFVGLGLEGGPRLILCANGLLDRASLSQLLTSSFDDVSVETPEAISAGAEFLDAERTGFESGRVVALPLLTVGLEGLGLLAQSGEYLFLTEPFVFRVRESTRRGVLLVAKVEEVGLELVLGCLRHGESLPHSGPEPGILVSRMIETTAVRVVRDSSWMRR